MRVALITGTSGQDGSYLSEALLAEGVEVHGLVRSHEAGRSGAAPPAVIEHIGDLADLDELKVLVQRVAPTEIYHLAGVSSVAQSWSEPVRTGLVSGLASGALLESAWQLQDVRGREVRFVLASSAEIFGAASHSPQDEDTPVRPINPYGAAKAYAHQMAAIYRSKGLAVSSMILFPHESPRRPASFVTRKITMAAAQIGTSGAGEIVLGNLAARRDWGWAPDFVDAMVRAARATSRPDDYVLATGVSHSVEDFARLALERAGVRDWRRYVRSDPSFFRPTDAAELVGNPRRAREGLGWVPATPFEEVVNRMVDHDLALAGGSAVVEP